LQEISNQFKKIFLKKTNIFFFRDSTARPNFRQKRQTNQVFPSETGTDFPCVGSIQTEEKIGLSTESEKI